MKKKFNLSEFFTLNWKKVFLIIVAWFVAVILHNIVYGLGIYFWGENFWGVNGDEAFFFIIAIFVIPVYFLISVVYSLIKWLRKKK